MMSEDRREIVTEVDYWHIFPTSGVHGAYFVVINAEMWVQSVVDFCNVSYQLSVFMIEFPKV